MRALILMLAIGLLAGCKADIPANDYFPLQEGVVWHYDVSEDLINEQRESRFSVQNMGTVKLKGEYEEHPVSVRRTSHGTDYYILQDHTGSHRIAKRTLVEIKPRFDDEERTVLPATADLEVGRDWSSITNPYLLHGLSSHSLPDPRKKQFIMSYEITSVNETVIVPAGEFSNCIKVEGTGVVGLYADPRIGYQDVNVTQTEWYAPGVGLVKLERSEPMDLDLYKGGVVTYELSRFEP